MQPSEAELEEVQKGLAHCKVLIRRSKTAKLAKEPFHRQYLYEANTILKSLPRTYEVVKLDNFVKQFRN
jgi:hypothetical protein